MGYEPDIMEHADAIIEWLAQGRSNREVAELAGERLDIEWSPADVARFRRAHADEIAAYIRQHADALLHRLHISHKPSRVAKIEELCEVLQEGVNECAREGRWNQAAKLADTILKAFRLVAEETQDLQRPLQVGNIYIRLIQMAPPEHRPVLVEQLRQIEAEMRAKLDEVRRSLEPTMLPGAIEGEFTEVREDGAARPPEAAPAEAPEATPAGTP